jgi:hypothetical protein
VQVLLIHSDKLKESNQLHEGQPPGWYFSLLDVEPCVWGPADTAKDAFFSALKKIVEKAIEAKADTRGSEPEKVTFH